MVAGPRNHRELTPGLTLIVVAQGQHASGRP